MSRPNIIVFAALAACSAAAGAQQKTDPDTGLVIDKGYEVVKGQCTACHSARLITQSGKTREGWVESIRWMQRNHKLWDLGAAESDILAYLEQHYGLPKGRPLRRQPIPAHLMPK
jgi:hypothetical protein